MCVTKTADLSIQIQIQIREFRNSRRVAKKLNTKKIQTKTKFNGNK